MKILDCTLRDGGYLNNWHFSMNFAQDLYQTICESSIDIIELGFIYPIEENRASGFFKCLTDNKIEKVIGKKNKPLISVMIDYGKFEPQLRQNKDSFIDMIRIAAHKKDIYGAIKLAEEIKKDKDYILSLQMMNTMSYSEQEIKKTSQAAINAGITYLYTADSYGAMTRKDIEHYIGILKHFNAFIGFHPHNNLEMAFSNAQTAIECGVDVVDTTVLGLGRGSGNLRAEIFVGYLEQYTDETDYKVEPILRLIEKHKTELQGYLTKDDIPYVITGLTSMHPNFATEAISVNRKYEEIYKKLLEIKNTGIITYKRGII